MSIFDTDTISNLLKKSPSPSLIQRLAQTPPEEQFTTSITIGELVYGVHRRPDGEQLWSRLSEKIDLLQVLPFDYESALTYGKLRAFLEKKGTFVAEADLRIGSIALTNKMTVVTGNMRHFLLIPELRVENWM